MLHFTNDGALDLFTVLRGAVASSSIILGSNGSIAIFICGGCSFSSSLESSSSDAFKFGGSKLGIESSLSSIGAVVAAMGAATVVDFIDSIVFFSSRGELSLVFVNASDDKHVFGLGGRGGPDLWLICHSMSESGCIIRAIW
jgi:hypothetical protein